MEQAAVNQAPESHASSPPCTSTSTALPPLSNVYYTTLPGELQAEAPFEPPSVFSDNAFDEQEMYRSATDQPPWASGDDQSELELPVIRNVEAIFARYESIPKGEPGYWHLTLLW